MADEDVRTLIDSAFRGVRIVICPKCEGEGEIREALHLPCPQCHGTGKTTERRP